MTGQSAKAQLWKTWNSETMATQAEIALEHQDLPVLTGGLGTRVSGEGKYKGDGQCPGHLQQWEWE